MCSSYDVHYVLQFDTSFEPKWPRPSFLPPDPKVKVHFIIWWFDLIQVMILNKMSLCLENWSERSKVMARYVFWA